MDLSQIVKQHSRLCKDLIWSDSVPAGEGLSPEAVETTRTAIAHARCVLLNRCDEQGLSFFEKEALLNQMNGSEFPLVIDTLQ